jgi:hypothetical protein
MESLVVKAARPYADRGGRVMGKYRDPQALFAGHSRYRALPFSAEWPICTV